MRSVLICVSVFACLGCTPQHDLGSYSEGAAQDQLAALEPAAGGGRSGSDVSGDEPRPEATSAAPEVTAAVDEEGPAGASLDAAGASPDASAPAAVEPGAPGDLSPVAQPAVDAGASCEALGGFALEESDSCYLLGDSVFAWQDARDVCQAWGGDLVEIGSPEESIALARRITASAWIGANDQEAEGSFRWASGAPLDFTQWAVNQPNNFGGNEDCSELVPFSGGWVDVPCTDNVQRFALCEQPRQ